MKLAFDVNAVEVTEFGVGLETEESDTFLLAPIDSSVQLALREMVIATRDEMNDVSDVGRTYEPSEKYGAPEHLHLPMDDELAARVRQLHDAVNVKRDKTALTKTDEMFCYFAKMTDSKGRRLTAVRRATSFKGILKSRLIQFRTDALKLVEDRIFKLDIDFDFLIDEAGVHILRPAGFEFVGRLEASILAAVPKNIKAVKTDLPFVDFAPIEAYAFKHPRAARYLASIRVQQETKNIDKASLKRHCANLGVEVKETKGVLVVEADSIMDFLGVLDRRLYQVELVKDAPESFRATGRSKIVKS